MGNHKTIQRTCENCFATFEARLSDIKKGWGQFCSLKCKNSGKNNPNYRFGGLSNYEYKLRAIEKFPEKHKARQIVQDAIRNGSLTKQPCSICGNVRSEAHHDDYTKPLEVKWLCRKHHIEAH